MENSQFLLNGGVLRLPPGFRFHPTDEELVVHYLRRKAYGCPLPVAIIPDIDLGKYDPWDLPGADEQDRYFFDLGDAKRRRGGRRRNRTANSGYWKPTGRDKKITASAKGGEVVGMKKVLAFHRGMLPHGVKTDWIMHEYRLVSAPSSMAPSRDLVLCRIFLKRGPTKMSIDGIEHHASARIGNASVGLVDLFRRQPSSSSESSCVTDLSEENTNEEEEEEEGEEEENSSNSIDSSSCKRQV